MIGVEALAGERTGDYRTVAELRIGKPGPIPATGDDVMVDSHHYEVVDMDGSRIDKVLVRPVPPPKTDQPVG